MRYVKEMIEFELNLYDKLKKYYDDGEILNREMVHKAYKDDIEPYLLMHVNDKAILKISIKGIKSLTVSTVITLFLQDIYNFCLNYENLLFVVTDVHPEYEKELIMEFKAATNIAKQMNKEFGNNLSTCILVEIDNSIKVIGFEEREEQCKLFTYLYNTKIHITSGSLADKEKVSNQSASNRLSRLYEKRVLFREEVALKQYEYYSI